MMVAGIGVDQDDVVAFLAQGLAGLGAGIIELAGLADDDGAGADEQDLFAGRYDEAWPASLRVRK